MSNLFRETEIKKEDLIDNLTSAQESKLQGIHAEMYTGLDDEMVDSFESWLMRLSLSDLEEYLHE